MVEGEHLSDKARHDLILVDAARKGNQAAYAELMTDIENQFIT